MALSVRPLASLDAATRGRVGAHLAAFAPERWPDADAALAELLGRAFEGGATAFVALGPGGAVLGTLGLVVRAIPVRGEAFLTAVAVPEASAHAFAPLLARALAALPPSAAPLRLSLGLLPRPHLGPLAAAAGFTWHEDALRLVLAAPAPAAAPAPGATPAPGTLRFTPLAAADPEAFRAVLNAAFLASPNGATLSPAEVDALRAAAAHDDLVGLYSLDGAPVGAHILGLAPPAPGATPRGEVDTLAVAPEAQGQGLGAHLLAHAVATLRRHGAAEIHLAVMSSNTRAVHLYERHGFVRVAATTHWYRRAFTPAPP